MSHFSEFCEWLAEFERDAADNNMQLEFIVLPTESESEFVESVMDFIVNNEGTNAASYAETKDHRLVLRVHGVKIGFDDRVPSGGYMFRFGHGNQQA